MRTDKLTSKFQLALADAQSLAVGREHQFVEPIHLMTALLEQDGSTVRGLLTKAGVNMNQLRSQLGDALDRQPTVSGGTPGEIHISDSLGKLLNVTDKLAQLRAQLGHIDAGFGQQPAHRAAVLLEQGGHQVDGLDELMLTAYCQRLGVRQGELKLARQFVCAHKASSA